MIIDFSLPNRRYEGHNFEMKHALDEKGKKWKMLINHWIPPLVYDFLILYIECGNIKIAIIDKIETCVIDDIYIAEIDFNCHERYGQMKANAYRRYKLKGKQ
jgi:hypothetical protein